ncbi:MAG: hypothetical protein KGL31_07320 [candidate division NC10 bacterium]|nr:hypothetical protein [candidate division NC10 bacterium]MDE2321712.1 hypothetical protein [candidate division NC10 bacterium]
MGSVLLLAPVGAWADKLTDLDERYQALTLQYQALQQRYEALEQRYQERQQSPQSPAGSFSLAPVEVATPPTTAAAATEASAGTERDKDGHEAALSDLTLFDLFSEGWNQAWAHRERRTPDMALLRVTTNFLEREFRADYAYTDLPHSPKMRNTQSLRGLIAYGLNRRLMIEALTTYQWNDIRNGPDQNGGTGGGLVRLQLVDTPDKSYAAQVILTAPNKGIGQTQTSAAYTLTGWQDLQALFPLLNRVGLYYSFTYENLQGPRPKAGAAQNNISYDLSIAKTWTERSTSIVGNLTTFLEAFTTMPLDGASRGKSTASLTPGIRFWFLPKNSLMLGADFPVSHPDPFREVYRFTYILNF